MKGELTLSGYATGAASLRTGCILYILALLYFFISHSTLLFKTKLSFN